MSLQPSKSDQDFTKNLIANQDVLLSPSIEQQNEATLDFFSFINNDSLMLNIIEQSNNVNSNQDNELSKLICFKKIQVPFHYILKMNLTIRFV